ncbi:Hypothetical predicted protein [Octopus vulgaris]|uniref:Uncharacterized protein n=1 Tax=Octopus vulgaris TaxID=6645 RepID=A0AA36B829_OCTVU|nr:Hypothetical predicted protein [Octopus vulgaris]
MDSEEAVICLLFEESKLQNAMNKHDYQRRIFDQSKNQIKRHDNAFPPRIKSEMFSSSCAHSKVRRSGGRLFFVSDFIVHKSMASIQTI